MSAAEAAPFDPRARAGPSGDQTDGTRHFYHGAPKFALRKKAGVCPGRGSAERPAKEDKEEAMIRASVFYPASGPEAFDNEYYFNQHYELCCDRLKSAGMVSAQFDKGVADGGGGKPPFHAIAHFVFNSVGDFQTAMGAHGQELMGDIPNYTKISPIIQISEIAAG